MKNAIHLPIDVLPLHDRINLRQNYLRAVIDGREEKLGDPFIPVLRSKGFNLINIEVPSYLTPYPEEEDLPLITFENYLSFFRENGFYHLVTEIKKTIHKLKDPFIIVSPDHSVTYGAIESLKDMGISPLIIIFDAHLDVVSPDLPQDNLNAGNFVKFIYESDHRGIIVAGTVDDPEINTEIYDSIPHVIREEYPRWKKRLKVIDYTRFNDYEKIFREVISQWEGEEIYLSIDIDVASGEDLWGVRFFEGRGISPEGLLESLRSIKNMIEKMDKKIVGMDFTEWDPLLMAIPVRGKKDKTLPLFEEIINLFF